MSPWVWRLGQRVVYVEPLGDGRARIRLVEREPSPSEVKREAEHRERSEDALQTWPMTGGGAAGSRAAWDKIVLEHKVERRALREGRGGCDDPDAVRRWEVDERRKHPTDAPGTDRP